MMTVIGHRGAAGWEPENTLPSFSKAIEAGADMVELDVQISADGEVVVFHDTTVDRRTDGSGAVTRMTWKELRQLDAGGGARIPLLDEVLNLVDRRVPVNVELKGEGSAEPVASLLNRYCRQKGWRPEDFLVSSFHHRELARFGRLMPSVPLGALTGNLPLHLAAFAEELGACCANISLELVNREFVEDARARGLRVYVYTVNRADDKARMEELGVDGIFTNYPEKKAP